MPDTPDPRNPMCDCGCWNKDFAAPNIDALAAAAMSVLDAFGSEAQTEPGPSRASQRADALDQLRRALP